MDAIEFNYQITEKDFVDYYHLYFYENKAKWIVNKVPIFLILSFLFFLLVLIEPTLINISILAFLITIFITLIILIPLFTSYFAKKAYRQNQQVHHINKYLINNDEIMVTTDYKTSIIYWHEVNTVYESIQNLYCITKDSQVLIIPKNKINVDVFIESIQENMPLIQYHLLKNKKLSI